MARTEKKSSAIVLKGGVSEKTVSRELMFFDRRELSVILDLYGRMVAAGEWRDYAIEQGNDHVAFAVFRRAAEHPLYRIVKRPALRRRQGQYAIIGMDGRILKRGHELRSVLDVLRRKYFKSLD